MQYSVTSAFKQSSLIKLLIKNDDDVFISRDFSNWKDAMTTFIKYEETFCHKKYL